MTDPEHAPTPGEPPAPGSRDAKPADSGSRQDPRPAADPAGTDPLVPRPGRPADAAPSSAGGNSTGDSSTGESFSGGSSRDGSPERGSPEAGSTDAGGQPADAGEETRRGRRPRSRSRGRKRRDPATDELAAEVAQLTEQLTGGGGGDLPRGLQGGRNKGRNKGSKARGSAVGHANDAVQALSAMLRHVLDSQKIPLLSRPGLIDLRLRIPLDARQHGPRAASQLVEQVLGRIDEVRENAKALVPGAVYCFFNETATAEGCRPNEPRLVFDGYGSTGRPLFSDFVTMAIERKMPGIDSLVSGGDVTLTHVSQGRVLRTAQLAEFGKSSPVFRILGQVDAGLFAVRGQEAKAAFSFQVLRGTGLDGRPALRLHPVGMCEVTNLIDHSVARILYGFQGDLDEAALRLQGMLKNGQEVDEEAFVLPLLQELAKRLADRSRHTSRRTEHANLRSDTGTRPTAKAYEEAQNVSDGSLLWDDKEGTIVVLGTHGRVHVFTPDARHVTSLNINRGAVQARLNSHRWRQTEPPERGEFRMQLRALMKSRRDDADEKAAERSGAAGTSRKAKARGPIAASPDSAGLQSRIASLVGGLGGAASPASPATSPSSSTSSSTSTSTSTSTSSPDPVDETVDAVGAATDTASDDSGEAIPSGPSGEASPGGAAIPSGETNPGGEADPRGEVDHGGEVNPSGEGTPGGEAGPAAPAAEPEAAADAPGAERADRPREEDPPSRTAESGT